MTPENGSQNNSVDDPFEFDRWAGKTKGVEGTLNSDFRITLNEVDELLLEETKVLPASFGEKQANRYIYSRPDAAAEERIVVKTYEFSSVMGAHKGLISAVTTYMAPTLPRCELEGLELGDICFGSHSDLPVAFIFARYNLLVEIKSVGTRAISVVDLATQIDHQILESTDAS